MTTKFRSALTAKIFVIIFFILICATSIRINAQEHWEVLSGPSNGVVYDFLGTNSGEIYCGTWLGGLFSTTNKGETWKQIESSFNSNTANYYSSINDSNYLMVDVGVYKSSDGGKTWNAIGLEDKWLMCVGSLNDSTYFAGGVEEGLFKTTNSGNSWTVFFMDSLPRGTSFSLKIKDGVIYYTGFNKVYKSVDGGNQWIDITPVKSYKNFYDIVVTENGNLICASDSVKIYKSTDFGIHWVDKSVGIEASHVRKLEVFNNKIIAGATNGIYVSNDEGESWVLKADYLSSGSIRALRRINEEIYAGTYFGGAYKSIDEGENWLEINSGLTACSVSEFFTANNTFYAISNYGGLSYTSNQGETWSIKIRVLSVNSIAISSSNYLFGSTMYNGNLRSTNNGMTWEFINNGLTDSTIKKIIVNDQDILFSRSTTGRLFRSVNYGDQWTELSNLQFSSFSDIFITPQNLLLAFDSENIYLSSDNGSSWTINPFINQFQISKLFLINDNKIFALSTQDSLFISIDLGENWTLVNSDMPDYAKQLVQDKKDRLFLIADSLFISTDNGVTWDPFNTEIENRNILSLGVDNLGNVYAGTSFTGTYKLVDTPVNVENSNENIINDFGLSQNYPNPFNPSTIIYFRLPVSGFITLKVYDILGREVAILLNESKPAGGYEVEFNAKNIPSGVYFYTLSAGAFKATCKMLLLK